jgi:hypothetical protein
MVSLSLTCASTRASVLRSAQQLERCGARQPAVHSSSLTPTGIVLQGDHCRSQHTEPLLMQRGERYCTSGGWQPLHWSYLVRLFLH